MKVSEGGAVLFGRSGERVRALRDLLAEHFLRVVVVGGPEDLVLRLPDRDCRLVVVTDRLEKAPDETFFARLRRFFPSARLIVLGDLPAGLEVVARSAGPVFVGSYEAFGFFSSQILLAVSGDGHAGHEHEPVSVDPVKEMPCRQRPISAF